MATINPQIWVWDWNSTCVAVHCKNLPEYSTISRMRVITEKLNHYFADFGIFWTLNELALRCRTCLIEFFINANNIVHYSVQYTWVSACSQFAERYIPTPEWFFVVCENFHKMTITPIRILSKSTIFQYNVEQPLENHPSNFFGIWRILEHFR